MAALSLASYTLLKKDWIISKIDKIGNTLKAQQA